MPVPGIPNNASGENGWQGFAPEQPYGEITNQQRLAGAAPLAGGPLASGPINAPDRAQTAAGTPPGGGTQSAAPTLAPAAPTIAESWATIAALPGISPLAQDYARRAGAQ